MLLKISLMFIMSLSLCAQGVFQLGLVPLPKEVTMRSGTFEFNPKTTISKSGNIDPKFLNFCSELLSNATGQKTKIVSKGDIKFILTPNLKKLSTEGYQLTVTKREVKIVANNQAGLFYGFQTFRQLLPAKAFGKGTLTGTVEVPCVEIVDDSQFKWRGILVDVSRRFQPKENILKMLDAMALCKLNKFHWHLTDDQGWRLEIKKFPNLTAKSKEFYSQEDVKEIVEFATQRNITIIPEIDVPGHSRAALKAYPKLKCYGKDGKPVKSSGTYCPASQFSYKFLDGVMAEVVQLFPGKYIHIGADEVGTRVWRTCPHCQALMKEKNLKKTHNLESYFVTKVSNIVEKYNRKVITWDEALNPHIPKSRTIMSWRGCEPGMQAAEMGLDTIITPVSSLYFDRTQSRSKFQKKGYSLNTVNLHLPYFMNPTSPLLSEKLKSTSLELKAVFGVNG